MRIFMLPIAIAGVALMPGCFTTADSSGNERLDRTSQALGGTPDGSPCTSGGDCQSTYCYPGPDQSYCIAESANCAEPGTSGAQFGSSYVYQGVTYDCVAGEGLVSPPFADGSPCTSGAQCTSSYCYPGPDQSYCIAESANCAEPGTGGAQFGSSYVYEGVTYDCVAGEGLVSPPFADGSPCTSGSQCTSSYCYPGPDQKYCIAASANCAEPGTSGAQFGTGYVYQGVRYDCVAGQGLVSAPFSDGSPCTSDSQCTSSYCYPGPDQSYCIAASANCAEPGTSGAQFGTSYVYQGVSYDCVAGTGLVPPPFGNGSPCKSSGECTSTYCYPGPDQNYCISATANCAQPGSDGVTYGQSYEFEGATYNCVLGSGLVDEGIDDGQPCDGSGCASGYCYPGPDRDYCIAEASNCAQPGTSGILFGQSYVYENVTYDCVLGQGLVAQ